MTKYHPFVKIKDAAQPYARNTDYEITKDTKIYLRGGGIDLYAAYSRIRPGPPHDPNSFTVCLLFQCMQDRFARA